MSIEAACYSNIMRDIEKSYIRHVAIAYKKAQESASYRYSWERLAEFVDFKCKPLFNQLEINFVGIKPYKNNVEMNRAIKKQKKLKIFTPNSEHPIWTKQQNWLFRLYHDYYGHYAINQPFTFQGELLVYQHHIEQIPAGARMALMTESIGELCYYFYYKRYVSKHKICNLLMFDPLEFSLISGG